MVLTLEEMEAACQRPDQIVSTDIVHARMSFPFKRRFHPLGFPVDISSNSTDVLDAAAQSWEDFSAMFSTPPVSIQVGVLEGDARECPPPPRCLVQQHIFSFVADQDNYGINDFNRGFSSIWVTRAA